MAGKYSEELAKINLSLQRVETNQDYSMKRLDNINGNCKEHSLLIHKNSKDISGIAEIARRNEVSVKEAHERIDDIQKSFNESLEKNTRTIIWVGVSVILTLITIGGVWLTNSLGIWGRTS